MKMWYNGNVKEDEKNRATSPARGNRLFFI
nr:MAG TPA: hypothetical protein [Caudoviricetes sp.]